MAATGHVLLLSSRNGGTQEPCAFGGRHRHLLLSPVAPGASTGSWGCNTAEPMSSSCRLGGSSHRLGPAHPYLQPCLCRASELVPAGGALLQGVQPGRRCSLGEGHSLGGGAPWSMSRAPPRPPIHMKAPRMQTGVKPRFSAPFQGPSSAVKLDPRGVIVHTCAHTHPYTLMHTHTHTRSHTCSHSCMLTHTHAHSSTYTCSPRYTHSHMFSHTCALTHRCTDAYMHTHTCSHAHTHSSTHMHMQAHPHTMLTDTLAHTYSHIHTHAHTFTHMLTHTSSVHAASLAALCPLAPGSPSPPREPRPGRWGPQLSAHSPGCSYASSSR